MCREPGWGASRLTPGEKAATASWGSHGEPRWRSGDRGKHLDQLAATVPVQGKDGKYSEQRVSPGGCVKWQDPRWLFERTPL